MSLFRQVLISVLILFLLLFSSGCEQKNKILTLDNTTNNDKKITIRFSSSWAGTDVKVDTLNQILASFMKENPDINIINESLSGGDYLFKLKTDFVSGNEPDVFAIRPGKNISVLIASNKIVDLTPTLREDPEWVSSFDKSVWNYVTQNDKIYGIPLEIFYQCMYVNTDLFRKYNVKIPETYTELKSAIETFKSNGVVPIAYGARSESNLIFQNIIASLGGKSEVETPYKNNEINSCYADAVTYFKELYDLGAFPQNIFYLDQRDCDKLFLDKNAAMLVGKSDFIGEINKRITQMIQSDGYVSTDFEKNIEMVTFPAIESGKGDPTSIIYGLGAGTFYVSNNAFGNSEKRDAVIRLLKFITSEKTVNTFIDQTMMRCSIKFFNNNHYYSGLMLRGWNLVDSTKELILPPESFFDKSVWEEMIVSRLPYILEGKLDSKSFWLDIAQSTVLSANSKPKD
ncbi:MAG: hypothetical protein BGN88_11045 [Clostridiales bacterium 43-6]|nr:MAG: hypothetical protein BGN88_11045 [Clostridiales bacterium 43-6]